MSTSTRSPSKRSSLASSASQSRRSVRFDDETLVSDLETIDLSLKKRLTSHPLFKSSSSSSENRRDDLESSRGRLSFTFSPTKLSDAASFPKIDTNTPKKDGIPRSRRRHSIVLSPTKHPVVASRLKIDSTQPMNVDDSPRRGRQTSVVPLSTRRTTSVPNDF